MKLTNFTVNQKDIDKTHFTSPVKIKSSLNKIQKKIVSDNFIDRKIKDRPKKHAPHKKENYYIPVFSTYPYAYQIDLLEQSNNGKNDSEFPSYFFIAININTRYAYAYPQDKKTQEECLESMKKLYKDTNENIVSISCDQEKGFQSKVFVDYLTANDISLRLIDDERHSALSILDRFIRTLRDMNTPGIESKKQSDDKHYRDFTVKRMNHLLDLYNKTIHTSIDMSPEDMQNDKEKERKYIIKKLYQTENRKKIKDYELKEGDFVRFMTAKDKNKKHRYKVSPEKYKISHKDGKSYVIMAEDGTVKTLQRWRLFLDINPNIKFGKTLGGNKGTLKKINKKVGKTKYAVDFEMPDGTVFKDTIHKNNLRGNTPQILGPIEKEFLKTAAKRNAVF